MLNSAKLVIYTKTETKYFEIPIVSNDYIYDIIEGLIKKYDKCNTFQINSVTYKDEDFQKTKSGHNVLFDVTVSYIENDIHYVIRYAIVDLFDDIGIYTKGEIKKNMFSVMNYFIWEKDYDIVGVKTYDEMKVETLIDGINFKIIRKNKEKCIDK